MPETRLEKAEELLDQFVWALADAGVDVSYFPPAARDAIKEFAGRIVAEFAPAAHS